MGSFAPDSGELVSFQGAPVVTEEVPGARRLVFRAAFPVGAWDEPRPGLACFVARLLEEGSVRRSGLELARDLELLGGRATTWCGDEALGVSLDLPPEHGLQALAWLEEVLLHPAFPRQAMERVAQQIDAELRADLAELAFRLRMELFRALWGRTPRGRPLLGTPNGVFRIGRAELEKFHAALLQTGLIVAIAGPPGSDRWAEEIPRRLPLCHRALGRRRLAELPLSRRLRRRIVLPQAEQAHWGLALPGLSRLDRRQPVFELLGIVLGSGGNMLGRLPQAIRERAGLAYHVSVEVAARAGELPGAFLVQVECPEEAVPEVEALVFQELNGLKTWGPTPEELILARKLWIGWRALARETVADRANRALERRMYGLPEEASLGEQVEATSVEALRDLAQELFRPERSRVRVGVPR